MAVMVAALSLVTDDFGEARGVAGLGCVNPDEGGFRHCSTASI